MGVKHSAKCADIDNTGASYFDLPRIARALFEFVDRLKETFAHMHREKVGSPNEEPKTA